MNRFKVFTLGSVRQRFILDGEREYLARLQSYSKIELHELNTGRLAKFDQAQRKRKEAELLLGKIKAGDFLVALDEKGDQFSSHSLAQSLKKYMNSGVSSFAFAIGGPQGFDGEVKKRAQLNWSLSRLTFPFQLTRLLVIEQLYRAMSILHGAPYHKE